MQSGTKLVLGIFGLAVVAGGLAWWYRYEAVHRATELWGPRLVGLIAEPSTVTAFHLQPISEEEISEAAFVIHDVPYRRLETKDLTKAPGMTHLRHFLLSDRNYRWQREVDRPDWRWCLQFADETRTATVLFTEDFAVLGRLNDGAEEVRAVDCLPMAGTLRKYFADIGVFTASEQVSRASSEPE